MFMNGLPRLAIRSPKTAPIVERVTYHESCHLCHGQKITQSPRELLRAIPGLKLIEMTESNWCCGSAGIYNITQPAMSQRLLKRKLGHILETAATTVASANPGCSAQLEAELRRRGSSLRVLHPVSLFAAALRQANENESF